MMDRLLCTEIETDKLGPFAFSPFLGSAATRFIGWSLGWHLQLDEHRPILHLHGEIQRSCAGQGIVPWQSFRDDLQVLDGVRPIDREVKLSVSGRHDADGNSAMYGCSDEEEE